MHALGQESATFLCYRHELWDAKHDITDGVNVVNARPLGLNLSTDNLPALNLKAGLISAVALRPSVTADGYHDGVHL